MAYKVEIEMGNNKDFQIDLEFTTDNIEQAVSQIRHFELKRRQMTPKDGEDTKYRKSYVVDKTGVMEIGER